MGPSSSKNMNKKKFMNPKGGVAKNKAKETVLKWCLLPLWQEWPSEEELQGLFRVLEEEGIRCPIYFRYVCH